LPNPAYAPQPNIALHADANIGHRCALSNVGTLRLRLRRRLTLALGLPINNRHMHSVTIRMDRVFDVHPDAFSGNIQRTRFSFESSGKRHFSVLVDGNPKLISGQTITAILKHVDDWQTVQGIRIHETGEIFAPAVGLDVWVVLLTIFSAGIFYMDLQYSHPESLTPTLAGHALFAAFFVRSAIFTLRIRQALNPMISAPQE
jgi:hypothetical protein